MKHLCSRATSISMKMLLLLTVAVLMNVTASPVFAAKPYKKLMKHLEKHGITELPGSEAYSSEPGVVIIDNVVIHQYFSKYSLWDIFWIEERYRVWRVHDPTAGSLSSFIIELGDDGELEDASVVTYAKDGTVTPLDKNAFKKSENKVTLAVSGLKSGDIVELKSRVKHNRPLYWDKRLIQEEIPILIYRYHLKLPRFIRNAPTQLFAPAVQENPFAYRFRAFDPVQKKFVSPISDKDAFSFEFKNLPAWKPLAWGLPKENSSAFLSFSLNELIVKDPTATATKEDQKNMNIPPDTPKDFIQSAGSAKGYKVPFETWEDVADFLYRDILRDLKTSKVFGQAAAEMVGSTSISTLKVKKIYDFLATEFEVLPVVEGVSGVLVPTVSQLEKAIQAKKATSLEMGFILYGLLSQVGADAELGLSFTHQRFVGEVDRKFPIPQQFNTSFVRLSQGKKGKVLYPGDSALAMGEYPPEIEGADSLFVRLLTDEELKAQPADRKDPNSPYLKVRERKLTSAKMELLQSPKPTAHKVDSRFNIDIAEDGAITGKGKIFFTGHRETEMRRALAGKNDEQVRQTVENWLKKCGSDMNLTSLKIKNLKSVTKPLTYEISFSLPYKPKGKTLTIPLNFFAEHALLRFKGDETLDHSIVFPYTFFFWDDVMFTFPKGWKLKSSPQNMQHRVKPGMFGVNIRQNPVQFDYQRGFTVAGLFFNKNQVTDLLAYYKKIHQELDAAQLVLEKK